MNFIVAISYVLADAFSTMFRERRWKLIPAFGIFLGLSALLVVVKAVSPIAPFVYSLF